MDVTNPYGITHRHPKDILVRVRDNSKIAIYNFRKKKFVEIQQTSKGWLTRISKLTDEEFMSILEKETVVRELSR